MLDRHKTGFIFVLIPERLPILETEKAIKLMSSHSLTIGGLVVNKILPNQADGEFLQKRREQEKVYLRMMQERFTEQSIYEVPLLEEDICTLFHLEGFASHLRQAIYKEEGIY